MQFTLTKPASIFLAVVPEIHVVNAALLEKQSGPPPLGIHLLMGTTAKAKLENVARHLREGRVVVFQAVAERV